MGTIFVKFVIHIRQTCWNFWHIFEFSAMICITIPTWYRRMRHQLFFLSCEISVQRTGGICTVILFPPRSNRNFHQEQKFIPSPPLEDRLMIDPFRYSFPLHFQTSSSCPFPHAPRVGGAAAGTEQKGSLKRDRRERERWSSSQDRHKVAGRRPSRRTTRGCRRNNCPSSKGAAFAGRPSPRERRRRR